MIDITVSMHSDANGGDPDSTSPTLKKYHQILWTKPLPNGNLFALHEMPRKYLTYVSGNEVFYFGSDSIAHSYRFHKRKKSIIEQVSDEAEELFFLVSTIGGYIIFPNNRRDNKGTINQERWVHPLIDDRFDLTLECIRRWYRWEASPLYRVFARYADFFDLFESFENYIDFFLLQDLVDDNLWVKFHLPFQHFSSPPKFQSVDDYREYKGNVMNFIHARNQRILKYCQDRKTD